jgi:serine/threonine protein kinase
MSSMPDSRRSSSLPEIIGGKYRVLAQIGKGGMATVYSAVHVGTERHVAVKVMTAVAGDDDPDSSSDPAGSLMRFEREARIAGNIDTQHVTRVFDTGVDPAHGPFIVMELLAGDDLKDLIRRLGPLRPDLALRIVGQACIGVARAHAHGVVHRDVKASNLFLAADEFGNRVVKVLDFGIAKGKLQERVDASDPKTLTKTGAMLGSPHYMSPEQVLGTKALDHRADLWSLGIVLYKCLSARTPFDDRDTVGQIIVSIVQGAPPSVQDFAPWVAPEIASLIANALKARPDERFQSAQEMFEAIQALVPGGNLEITPAMLTPMSDEERQDVKPRHSTRITLPDGMLAARRLSQTKSSAPAAPVSEADSTIGSATSSLRRTSTRPTSLRSKVGAAAIGAFVLAAALWNGSRHEPSSSLPAVAVAPPAAIAVAAPAVPAQPPVPTERHVSVRVQPSNATVSVDDVETVARDGSVEVVGDLGSVHRIRLRLGPRDVTAEVIVAEDGARPRLISLPDPRAVPAVTPAATSFGRRGPGAPGPVAAPAKSAAHFDTQFE